jgi:hypothetical protein
VAKADGHKFGRRLWRQIWKMILTGGQFLMRLMNKIVVKAKKY